MKHLVWAAAAGTLLASSAFADFSIKTQGRIEADVFTYDSPSRSTRPNNGDMYWSKDTKRNDDVTLEAKGGDSGAKLVFSVNSNSATNSAPGGANGTLSMTSYQIWTNLFGIRLDAGAYDQRLAKNLNNDGDFNYTMSANRKPGLWVSFDGADWGKDAANITAIQGNKKTNNFQVSKSGLLDGKLTVRGVLFFRTDSNGASDMNGSTNKEKWVFTPFALGGLYKLDKNTEIGFNAKLNNIVHDASNIGQKIKADNSVWTLNGNIYKKLASGMEVEAHYTLGASLYSNWSGHGAHGAKKTIQSTDVENRLVRDFDVFAHGVDFKMKKALSDELSMTLVTNLTYVQSTEIERHANRHTHNGGSDKKTYFKDSRAKSYYMGAAGTLAYYASLSVDYKQSDMITYQLQTNIEDNNVFDYAEKAIDGGYKYIGLDYYKNMVWRIRPAVIIKPDSYATISAGVRFDLSGFQQNATGSKNKFKTTVTVPVGLRVKI